MINIPMCSLGAVLNPNSFCGVLCKIYGIKLLYFYYVHGSLMHFLDRFPALNSLIQRINVRKRRDAIILASVISICLILMLIYALG